MVTSTSASASTKKTSKITIKTFKKHQNFNSSTTTTLLPTTITTTTPKTITFMTLILLSALLRAPRALAFSFKGLHPGSFSPPPSPPTRLLSTSPPPPAAAAAAQAPASLSCRQAWRPVRSLPSTLSLPRARGTSTPPTYGSAPGSSPSSGPRRPPTPSRSTTPPC